MRFIKVGVLSLFAFSQWVQAEITDATIRRVDDEYVLTISDREVRHEVVLDNVQELVAFTVREVSNGYVLTISDREGSREVVFNNAIIKSEARDR
jgi:hypothetical protein